MSTLHTVNKSPFNQCTLRTCIGLCQPNDAVLLIEDGVYGALPACPDAEALQGLLKAGIRIYALEADLQARGLTERCASGIEVVDYTGFVALTVEHKTVQSWY